MKLRVIIRRLGPGLLTVTVVLVQVVDTIKHPLDFKTLEMSEAAGAAATDTGSPGRWNTMSDYRIGAGFSDAVR